MNFAPGLIHNPPPPRIILGRRGFFDYQNVFNENRDHSGVFFGFDRTPANSDGLFAFDSAAYVRYRYRQALGMTTPRVPQSRPDLRPRTEARRQRLREIGQVARALSYPIPHAAASARAKPAAGAGGNKRSHFAPAAAPDRPICVSAELSLKEKLALGFNPG